VKLIVLICPKEYLESVDRNIDEFDEIYDEIVQHLNEILSLLEKYFSASEDIKYIQKNNWVKNSFLIKKNKPEEISTTEK